MKKIQAFKIKYDLGKVRATAQKAGKRYNRLVAEGAVNKNVLASADIGRGLAVAERKVLEKEYERLITTEEGESEALFMIFNQDATPYPISDSGTVIHSKYGEMELRFRHSAEPYSAEKHIKSYHGYKVEVSVRKKNQKYWDFNGTLLPVEFPFS